MNILFYSLSPVKGKFKNVSSEYEFSIDDKEELYITKNDFKDYHSEILFSFINIDKNYLKLFSSKGELKDIISYKKKIKIMSQWTMHSFYWKKGNYEKLN